MSIDRPKKKLTRGAYRSLRTELDFLKREGVLSPETVSQAVDRYETPDARSRDFGTLVFLATTTLGVLALGFAAFLVLRYNWNYLTPTTKTGIAAGFLAVAYAASFAFRRRGRVVLSELFAFGGALLFGVNVWQIAQIYQFDLELPEGVWVWGFGVFLLAFFARLPILHYLSVGILAVWVGSVALAGESFIFCEPDVSKFSFPSAAYTAPIFAALGYYWGVRRRAPSVSIPYLFLFVFWGAVQPFFWRAESSLPFFEALFGGVLWLFGSCIAKQPGPAKAARLLGAVFVLGFLIPTTCRDFYRYACNSIKVESFVPFAAVLVLAVAALGVRWKRGTIKRGTWAELALSPFGVSVALIPTFLAFVYFGLTDGANYRYHSFPTFVPFLCSFWSDVLSVALAGYFVVTGAAGRPIRYWLGTLYFVLWSILRYVDLFGDVGGVLGAALFFVGIAAFLFVAAYLFQAKIRGRIVESIPNPDALTAKTNAENPVAPTSEPTPPNAPVLKIGTCAAVFVQFAAIFGVVAVQTATFADAKTILVETTPVDPTDLFRGDYVVLNYPFSTARGVVWENGKPRELLDVSSIQGDARPKRVYAKLRLDPTDGVYKPFAITAENLKVADDEIALRGRRRDVWRIVYGIEAFFLQEGSGREIENAVAGRDAQKKALVELLVAPNGKARVRGVKLVDVAPTAEAQAAIEAQNIAVSVADPPKRLDENAVALKIDVFNRSDADVVLGKFRRIVVEVAAKGDDFAFLWNRSNLVVYSTTDPAPGKELILAPGEKATFEALVSRESDAGRDLPPSGPTTLRVRFFETENPIQIRQAVFEIECGIKSPIYEVEIVREHEENENDDASETETETTTIRPKTLRADGSTASASVDAASSSL